MPVDESWLLLTKTYAAVATAALLTMAAVLLCLALRVRRLARWVARERRALAEQARGIVAGARSGGRETAGSVGRIAKLVQVSASRLARRPRV